MGEVAAIRQYVTLKHASSMDDEACLKVISPPENERKRMVRYILFYYDELIIKASIQSSFFIQTTREMPKLEAWRYDRVAGLVLDCNSEHAVRSNFFLRPTQHIPWVLHQYDVSIFR